MAVEDAKDNLSKEEFSKVLEAIGANIKSSKGKKDDEYDCYSMVLIMPFGDQNLDSIYRFEQPDTNIVRGYIKAVANALNKLHNEGGICHGDLAMRTIMRFHGNLKLINFGASANFPKSSEQQELEAKYNYVGSKFSSGILPPEMIARLDKADYDAFVKYFVDEKRKKSKYWEKIQPRVDGNFAYVVKTFKVIHKPKRKDLEGNKMPVEVIFDEKKNLPYEPVYASEAIDLWSLGVLLYLYFSNR